MEPVRAVAAAWAAALAPLDAGAPQTFALRSFAAGCELLARAGLTHHRPPFGISSVTVGSREVPVHEQGADVTPTTQLTAAVANRRAALTKLMARWETAAPAQPGREARRDNEYERCGTANVFCAVEPKTGRHFTFPTPDRSGFEFANCSA